MNSSIGGRIQHLLDYRGMTQRELAEKAGITEAAVSRYLKDERTPRAITVASIAKALEVPVSEIVGDGDCAGDELDNAVRLIARNARAMTEAQREEIIRALAHR